MVGATKVVLAWPISNVLVLLPLCSAQRPTLETVRTQRPSLASTLRGERATYTYWLCLNTTVTTQLAA